MSAVTCSLCPRHCRIALGERGFCYARGESLGKVTFMDYGKLSALAIDPIEKKPLYHFLPGSDILSVGMVGCNLNCKFCQNCHISRDRTGVPLHIKATPPEIVTMAKNERCPSIAFTYNEPLISFEYVMDVSRLAHSENIKTVAVTAGYVEGPKRRDFFSVMDAANIDLKGFTEEFYSRNCGARLAPVLETLQYVHEETSCWLEVTTLLIPGENDSEEELDRMSDWYAKYLGPDVPWHFSAFYPRYQMMDKIPTPKATLTLAKKIAESKGLHYVYLGNVEVKKNSNTFCPHCQNELIVRQGMYTENNNMVQGACPQCHSKIPGVFL